VLRDLSKGKYFAEGHGWNYDFIFWAARLMTRGSSCSEACGFEGPRPRCVHCGAVYATVDIWGKSQHSDEEVADYDDGFKAGFRGHPNDDGKSQAWQRGWEQAQGVVRPIHKVRQ
jgi:hypothetical protein